MARLWIGQRRNRASIPGRDHRYSLLQRAQILGSTQPNNQWAAGAPFLMCKEGGSWSWPLNPPVISRSRICVVMHPLFRTPAWCWPLLFHHDTKLQDISNDVGKQVRRSLYVQIYWDGLRATGRLFIPTFMRICHLLCMAVATKIRSSWTTVSSRKAVFCYCSRVMTILHHSLASSLANTK